MNLRLHLLWIYLRQLNGIITCTNTSIFRFLGKRFEIKQREIIERTSRFRALSRPSHDSRGPICFGDSEAVCMSLFRKFLLTQARTMTTATIPTLKPFKLALIQLGQVGASKEKNLAHARDMLSKAAKGSTDGIKPNLLVLPVRSNYSKVNTIVFKNRLFKQECFNSPYGHQHFPEYAEIIKFNSQEPYSISNSPSESIKMLSNAAKEAHCWLIGGHCE